LREVFDFIVTKLGCFRRNWFCSYSSIWFLAR